MKLPHSISQFNIYNDNERCVGVSGEITLPNFEAMSETISGAGIAGEFEVTADGQYGAMQIDIPFLRLHDENFSLLTPGRKTIVLRASAKSFDSATGESIEEGLKIKIVGTPKSLELGKIASGKPMESKNTLEILAIKIEIGDKVLMELDKLNFICIINGVDVLAKVKANI